MILATNSVEALQEPIVLGVVTVSVILAYHYQKGLTYYEYQFIHSIRIILFEYLETQVENETKIGRQITRYVGDPILTREKGMPDNEDEYVLTVEYSLQDLFYLFVSNAASPHLISSVKYRDHPNNGREYARAHVIFAEGGKQTEVWMFDNGDTVDIYAHKETVVTDPEGHLTEPYTPGDPDGYIAGSLSRLD